MSDVEDNADEEDLPLVENGSRAGQSALSLHAVRVQFQFPRCLFSLIPRMNHELRHALNDSLAGTHNPTKCCFVKVFRQ